MEPIAIVGQACTLPEAHTPAELWANVMGGRDCLSHAPAGRWGVGRAAVTGTVDAAADRTWTDVGGYVRGFEAVFDPTGFLLPEEEVLALDPHFQWALHGAREALRSAGHEGPAARAGLVLGGLSFPTSAMARYAESVWLEAQGEGFAGGRAAERAGVARPHARNRFSSGLPAHLTARALGLGAGAFSLDAACASSLYAVKLACDRLHDRSADLMVAGAVSRTDDLFLHVGFCALEAMSRSGRSRPFHRGADGLVPAEGAGFVVLQRLADAVAAGRRILGVVRGLGLSNDGRGRGLLAPSEEGQERAMRLAYRAAGIAPRDVELLECHATGTPVGDAAEVRSTARVFAGCEGVPVGSLKSNLGHLVAAAGVAGLIKLLAALESGRRPPTLHVDEPLDALAGTPFRLLREAEPWEGPRRAAISAFGFGGNNAHLIVEAWEGGAPPAPAAPPARAPAAVAIVGLGARVGEGEGAPDFARALFEGTARPEPRSAVEVALDGLRSPPRDLSQALGQQVLILEAAREAAAGLDLPRERTAVMVGMGCDPELARYGARWKVGDWAERWAREEGGTVDPAWLEGARDAFQGTLQAAGALGAMPNIPANRINSQLDVAGPGFTIAAEEASGLVALELAARALRKGELDAAVVGAVDLSHEAVHLAALGELGRSRPPGDAAVALVLKRLEDARRDGDPVYAVLGEPAGGADEGAGALALGDVEPGALDLARAFGSAHAANGLLHVAAGALALRHRRRPRAGAAAASWPEETAGAGVRVCVSVLEAPPASARLLPGPPAPPPADPPRPAGARLSLPSHLPPPRLPAFRAAEQGMARAPELPPVLPGGRSAAPEPPASVAAEAAPAAGAAGRVPARSAAVGPAARLAAHQERVGTLHRAFLEEQAEAHRRFLALRRSAEAALFQACGAALAGGGARVGPPPPASPPGTRAAPPAPPLRAFPAAAPPPPPAPPGALPGPKYDRAQLEVLAGGRISSVFGPLFAAQDGYRRQVRMPEPPLLLADRVTGIDAEPGSMGTGTLWTETDVREDAWYLDPAGRMPAGIMVEAGQADLLLISWLGVDLLNRGERVYRLLGCELTFHGPPCVPGDRLAFEIHVDGHARQGDVRLFFFHYDCRVGGDLRISARHAQAGFFTDQELRESAGVLWNPEDEPCDGDAPVDPPAVPCRARAFAPAAVRAFSEGRPLDCFGPGWEPTLAHVRTPRIAPGRMLFLGEVPAFDPHGGPWRRGYLRAETPVTPGDWFFDGHFKDDPCMPGTLMFEGCLQGMAFYLAALGFTVERDGWVFEVVPGETYAMRCRGQATPASRRLVYEVFVSEVRAAPLPTVFADLLCTVDGLKVFHARRVGLRLVPDWPLEHWRRLGPPASQRTGEPVPLHVLGGLRGHVEPVPPAAVDGFAFGYPALLACAWGRPSAAFGPSYARFDGPRRLPRLPGPPYHFVSRVTRIDSSMGAMEAGGRVEVEYDVPAEQWYFAEGGGAAMPCCVLMEAALQPCGFLAMFVGSVLASDGDLLFRNLDGRATLHEEVPPGAGTLRTRVELRTVSRTPEMIVESFAVECFLGERRVYELTAVFGFFPPEAFQNQVGLPASEEERARLAAPSDVSIDLAARPERFFGGPLALPGSMLLMLDRVTGYSSDGGRAGLGYLRAEKDVRPEEWFFKAHFFQDPVQPGSLGIEAMLQLLQLYMIERGMGEGVSRPRFEPIAVGRPVSWTFRGQVVPASRTVTVELEVAEAGRDARGSYAVAEAWLWVDGRRIYHARDLGLRIVPGPEAPGREEVLDPAVDTWIADHRPTWTLPVLPMMSMVDRLVAAAEQATGRVAVALEDVGLRRWLPFAGGPVRLRTEVAGGGDAREVTLLAWRDAGDPALSRFEPVATGRVRFGPPPEPPPPLALLDDLEPVPDPYASGRMFHGPAFHYLTELRMGAAGSSAVLRAERGTVPRGRLHQGLLDAATHAIPHDALRRWSDEIPEDVAAYPHRVPEMRLHGPLPDAGEVRVEVRFAGFDGDRRFPAFDVRILSGGGGGRALVSFRLVGVLLPKGPIGSAPPAARRTFLRDRRFVPGVALSTFDGAATRLGAEAVHRSDWLPGNVAWIYGVPPARRGELVAEVAVREHVTRQAFVHPSAVVVEEDLTGARAAVRLLRRHPVRLERAGDGVTVTDAGPPVQDLAPVRRYWSDRIGIGPWPVEDLYYGLIERFVGDVVVVDPEAFERLRGRSCLYLGNHQVGIESLLFSVLLSALGSTPTVTLAKAEHRTSWLGWLIAHSFSYPGVTDPRLILFFERENREELLKIVAQIGAELRSGSRSAMVHVEGTRALTCRHRVERMSSAFIDMALSVGAPIVPVRFVGGLPVAPAPARLEFPVGFGRQDYWLGRPILPEELGALPYKERKAAVIGAINGLGPDPVEEEPAAPDPAFGAAVEAWTARTGATPESAVFFATLAALTAPGDEVRALLDGARAGRLALPDDLRGRWLAGLAARLFGPRGPRVDIPGA